jgi:WD40 repeat protein
MVRVVALGEEFVVSGSYDLIVKVWERKTGKLVADLKGGHTARIFCLGFDCTKVCILPCNLRPNSHQDK